MEVFLSNSSNYTKDVVVFFDGLYKFIKELKSKKEVKNISVSFKNMLNKKIKGLFSGTIIELNGKQCMLIVCQIMNNKCIKDYLLNYFV